MKRLRTPSVQVTLKRMLRRFAVSMLLVFALAQASSLGCVVHCAAMRHVATDGMAMSGCASGAGMSGAGMSGAGMSGAGMSSKMGMTRDASSAHFAASMRSSSSTMPCAGPCSQQQEVMLARGRTLRVPVDAESSVTLRTLLAAHLRAQFFLAFQHRPPSVARLPIPLRI